VRGITAPPIVISQLLDTPEARAIKARGAMVGDREVVGILWRKLLEPEQQNGALLDGFPRTKVQVECLKLLFDEMIAAPGVFRHPRGHPLQAAHLSHHDSVHR
jgi:adenylate kinase